ncbi:MAG: hypothetical protein NC118_03535 [Eubacterium sp.]|nr:hypothetical protein [Eubacterium sp.]
MILDEKRLIILYVVVLGVIGNRVINRTVVSDYDVAQMVFGVCENSIINIDSLEEKEIIDDIKKQYNLKELMSELQKVYIQKDFWYNMQSINFCIRNQGYAEELQPTDLEQVTFYIDIEEEELYFVPSARDEMFLFYKKEVTPRRNIIPQPDTVKYVVYQKDITEIKDRLIELGTVEMPFPGNEEIEDIGWANNDLVYNEYMQAVEDMIHGTLKDEGKYGNFEIYIEEYEMTDFTNPYEEDLGKTAIYISGAVVCLDDGYGYCCNFIASDLLLDGNVKIYYHVPPTINVWEEFILQMKSDNRMVISLTVTPEDEIEVPYNPYPFVMLPILNYAIGEDRFPENAIHTETMVFY